MKHIKQFEELGFDDPTIKYQWDAFLFYKNN
jgi:hypothetical protein